MRRALVRMNLTMKRGRSYTLPGKNACFNYGTHLALLLTFSLFRCSTLYHENQKKFKAERVKRGWPTYAIFRKTPKHLIDRHICRSGLLWGTWIDYSDDEEEEEEDEEEKKKKAEDKEDFYDVDQDTQVSFRVDAATFDQCGLKVLFAPGTGGLEQLNSIYIPADGIVEGGAAQRDGTLKPFMALDMVGNTCVRTWKLQKVEDFLLNLKSG